jgi:hypothetical protein
MCRAHQPVDSNPAKYSSPPQEAQVEEWDPGSTSASFVALGAGYRPPAFQGPPGYGPPGGQSGPPAGAPGGYGQPAYASSNAGGSPNIPHR